MTRFSDPIYPTHTYAYACTEGLLGSFCESGSGFYFVTKILLKHLSKAVAKQSSNQCCLPVSPCALIYITFMAALLISTHFCSAHVIFLVINISFISSHASFSLEKQTFICLWLLSHNGISVIQRRLLAKFYLKCRIYNSWTLRLNQWSLQKRRRNILRARETGSLLWNCGVIHMNSQQNGCLYMAWIRTTPISMLVRKRESSLKTSTLEKELWQLGNFTGKVISTGYSKPTDQPWKHMLTRNIIQTEHYAHIREQK